MKSSDTPIKFADAKPTSAVTENDAWNVLIADDEEDVHQVTRYALQDVEFAGRKINFISTYSAQESIEIFSRNPPIAVVLLDVVMETDDAGLRVVKYVRETLGNSLTRIILRTGHPGQAPETSVIVNYDINDYKNKTELTKSKLFTTLIASLRSYQHLYAAQAVKQAIEDENRSLKKLLHWNDLENREVFSCIKTVSPAMISLFRYAELTACSSRPVFISGETGVGKELFAKVIHQLSGRTGEMVTVNVGGLDDNLFSDTLFGHEKGAFTGADRARNGLIERAAGGTLFLDEIGDLTSESQVKLLRLLQDREYYKLGSDVRKHSDVRIIVATHHDLAGESGNGRFRQDLYYRLSTHHIHIPPLNERKGDIGLLLEHFVNIASIELKRPSPTIPSDVLSLLERYNFPGNIRELEAMVFDAVNRTTGRILASDVFEAKVSIAKTKTRPAIADLPDTGSFKINCHAKGNFPTMTETTDRLIVMAMDHADGNQTVAAQLLGISRQALNYKLKKIEDKR